MIDNSKASKCLNRAISLAQTLSDTKNPSAYTEIQPNEAAVAALIGDIAHDKYLACLSQPEVTPPAPPKTRPKASGTQHR